MWWIVLLFHMVYADDDSWGSGEITLPPHSSKRAFRQSFPYANKGTSLAMGSDVDPAGYYQYKYVKPDDIDEILYTSCHSAGHGPPKKYARAADVWNNIDKRIESIEAEKIWCSIPDNNFEISSYVLNYHENDNKEIAVKGGSVATTMKQQYDKPSTHHGVSNGWTFPVGDEHHIDPAIEQFNQDMYINGRWTSVPRIAAYFPWSRENARDRAIRMVKEAASVYGSSEFCKQWNIVAAGGMEYKEMPEYIRLTGNTFEAIVSLVEGIYRVQVKWFKDETQFEWRNIDHTNIESFVEEVKSISVGDNTDPNRLLRRHLWNVQFIHRLNCEDYGYEHLVEGECDNSDVKEYVGLHPSLFSNGDDLCRYKSTVDVYVYDAGYGTTNANVIDGLIRFNGNYPIVVDQPSTLPKTKLFCKKNHDLDPVQTDHVAAMQYKYALEKIHQAHTAVMSWAYNNCKNRAGSWFTSTSDFSCLLGANDIVMKGPSFTFPLPYGFAAGWTIKNVKKGGFSFIVKKKYSFCVITEEEASMQGPKVAWKPALFLSSMAKARELKDAAADGAMSMRSAMSQQLRKENPFRNFKNFAYNPQTKAWGGGTKFAVQNLGREATNAGVRDVKKETGIPLEFVAEYWMEEGSCTPGSNSPDNCKLSTSVYSWDMIAATASFFSASARVSYIRVYKTGYESNVPDSGFLNSIVGNFVNSGVLSFFQGPSEGWDRYLLQLRARIQIVPNLGQIAIVAYGKPIASTSKNMKEVAEAKKKAMKNPKRKWVKKYLAPEFVISVEKAHGQGIVHYTNDNGRVLPIETDWFDYHGGTRIDIGDDREMQSNYYWRSEHIKAVTKPQPLQHMVPCYTPVDPNEDDTYMANRFPINSCKPKVISQEFVTGRKKMRGGNSVDPEYMPVSAPTREVQIRIPATHRSYKIKGGSRSILTHNDEYNLPDLPDISYDDDVKYDDGTVKLDTEMPLLAEKMNHITVKNLDNVPSLSNGYIHGLSDILEENTKTMNPYAVTNANEKTGVLQVKKPIYQFITQYNCDVLGLTSIRLITDVVNDFLKDYLDIDPDTWNDINKDLFVETTNNGDEIIEENITDIHASPLRPYGLIVSGYRGEGKPLIYRQTERYLYGQKAETSGSLTKHLDCNPEFRCICLGPSDYAYIDYTKLGQTEYNRKDLIMHPVDTYQECKIAQQHKKDKVSDDMFQDLSYYMNKRYEGPGVRVVRSATLGAGCITYGGKIVFNIHRDATFSLTTSLVKVLKLRMSLDDSYENANQYQRIITRKKIAQDTVEENLNVAVEDGDVTRISLSPQTGHDIEQVQMIHQDGVLKYFPIGEDYEALKDTNASHILYGNKLHSWRFVDQYLKTNKQRVEKYTEAPNSLRSITYLDVTKNVWNNWNASALPEGRRAYSFVQNLGTYVATDNEIIVPEVDFIADRRISFHGKNIPMKEKVPINYSTDKSTPANGISCEVSLMLPNRCPAGYGMDGDKVSGDETDVYGVPYKYGVKRQCALCPIVNTCKPQCTDRYTKQCLDCLSPEGHYRCQIDVTKCDKPGYVWVTTHRGGKRGHLTGHCVKTDIDPKEEDQWHTTNLQKEYWDRGEPFFPHRWEKDGIPYIRNEKSTTSYLTCNPGYVPVKATDEEETCSGYVCEKCPPTYIEDNQICVKCAHRQVSNDNNVCEDVYVPKGHFFDSQNVNGVTVDNINYPFVSHCDRWLNHPAGAIGAYQDNENQLVCKTSNTTSTNFGEHAVLFKGGIVKFWSTPGRRVNSDRSAVVNCEDHQVCNGEEITGCKPGYIWKQQTPGRRDDEECFPCNSDNTILGSHSERDNYEYCDGTHMFRCADASYTDAYELGFNPKIAGIHNDLFVGVRDEWENSQLVHKPYDRFAFRNWNKIPFETQSSGAAFTNFKADEWTEPVQGDHKANWRSFEGRDGIRGIELYEYNSGFTVDSLRVENNEKFNPGAKCYPVPDGFFALPNEWKKKDCGFSKELCVHRTFHEIIPFKPNCTIADKHFLSNAVKEECYDYIYRWEDRMCTDGLLPGGCNKEYCTREGQSNCWCGDEENFCTMGCVNGMCQEICGDRVCKEYELCYGEFNAIKSFAQCVIECQEPKSNYCLWKNDKGNTVYCRHFNTGYESPIMQTLDPRPTSPCFDEMPNIPETQCQDTFDNECFCGRTFIDNPDQTCVKKQVKGFCNVLQDDGTCTYETSDDGICVCGDTPIDTKEYQKCYAVDEACGPKARTKQLCSDILGDEDWHYIDGCQPTGIETQIEYCAKASSIIKDYVDIAQEPNLKCVGTEIAEIEGCVDPQGKNYNEFATIPKKCQY